MSWATINTSNSSQVSHLPFLINPSTAHSGGVKKREMNTLAEDIFLRGHGSLSIYQMEKDRRPYHKNCTCALHKTKKTDVGACFLHGNTLAMKKSWYKCSLSIQAPNFLLFQTNKDGNIWNIGSIDQWFNM